MIELTASVTQAEYRRVNEFIAALRTPCKVGMNPHSPLNSPEFESEFRSKLLPHHAFMGTPLFQEGFHSAFISACEAAGHETIQAPVGRRFWDVTVRGRRISLKSTKAKGIREETLHISKLTEAAWIQDCRSAATRREHTFKLFKVYRSEVVAIIQLRYFMAKRKYELVEIPVSLFSQVFALGKSHFAADGPTINIPIGKQPPDFTL